MSRTKRKTPIHGMTLRDSEKKDKQLWHRAFRRKEKLSLSEMEDPEDYLPPDVKEVSDPWNMAKDGKQWYEPDDGDPEAYKYYFK